MARLLDDDRLIVQIDEMTNDMNDELQYLACMPASTFEMIGKAFSISPRQLRSDCVIAGLTQAGFLENRFREARQPPWSLLSGDREENLNRLAEGPEPSEEVPFKVYLY